MLRWPTQVQAMLSGPTWAGCCASFAAQSCYARDLASMQSGNLGVCCECGMLLGAVAYITGLLCCAGLHQCCYAALAYIMAGIQAMLRWPTSLSCYASDLAAQSCYRFWGAGFCEAGMAFVKLE